MAAQDTDYSAYSLEELVNGILDANGDLGEWSGWQYAADYLEEMSGKFYAKRRDDEAETARAFSDELRTKAKLIRQRYENKKAMQSACWAEIAKREKDSMP